MAANAKRLAVDLSRTAMDYDRQGGIVRVTDPKAQAVLGRVFERMLKAGGAPQLTRLSEAEAAAFPRQSTPPGPRATAWLAVGIDKAGMATYALRWLDVSGLDPVNGRAAAGIALFAELAVECGRSGFPVAGHA
jgi:hypothetical protein